MKEKKNRQKFEHNPPRPTLKAISDFGFHEYIDRHACLHEQALG